MKVILHLLLNIADLFCTSIDYNILFLYSNIIDPIRGGIESVTYELAKYFSSKGYLCYYLTLNNTSNNDDKQFYLPDSSLFLNEKNNSNIFNSVSGI